jgi:hypothetical protein
MSIELRVSSSPILKYPRVHLCECGCIHEDSLFPTLPGVFNFSTDGALADARPYFPGLKVGQIYLYSTFTFTSLLVALKML